MLNLGYNKEIHLISQCSNIGGKGHANMQEIKKFISLMFTRPIACPGIDIFLNLPFCSFKYNYLI